MRVFLKKLWSRVVMDPEQARMERYLSQAVDHAHLNALLKEWNVTQTKNSFWR